MCLKSLLLNLGERAVDCRGDLLLKFPTLHVDLTELLTNVQ